MSDLREDLKPVWIYIENDVFLEAKAFGKSGTKIGEIIFNTSMSGYQEVLSDASYAGQFIVFTAPEIGVVGTNDDDIESESIFASGIIVRNYNNFVSNFRSNETLSSFLSKFEAMGITDIDTRFLTKLIRNNGACMMIASTEISSKEELKKMLLSSKRIEEINYVKEVSTKEPYIHKVAAWDYEKQAYKIPKNNGKKIAVLDFGVKKSILNELCEVGFEVLVLPYNTSFETIISKFNNKEINGVLLTNGPGDPKLLSDIIENIRKLVDENIPLLGICLGHQLLSIAQGYDTYKMQFGQHGGNHPVKNSFNNLIEITSQNHIYCVPESVSQIANITHRNLFDGSIEGLEYKNKPIFSVQHHPEAGPGPHEGKSIFEIFAKRI